MMKIQTIAILFLFFCGLSAHAKSILNSDADIVVAFDGSGDFTKIQDAINAVPSNSDRQWVIYIKRGFYNSEKLIIPYDKKNIYFIGESRDETIISYHIYDCSDGKCPVEDAALWTGDNIRTSATLTVQGDGFRAENLTIENTAGPVGQALAITIQADKVVFVNCNLKGYQDTIYMWSAGKRTYYKNCLVTGRTDYIYGAGIGFFDYCEIRSYGGGWITAPSTPKAQPYGFVFSNCSITYALNSPRSGDDGAMVRLGRPWHEYPKVAWLYCNMTEKIHPEGWGDTWNMDYAAASTDLHLYEYMNTGAGAEMNGRANWAGLRSLTSEEAAEYTAQKVLAGTDNWDPAAEPALVQTYEWIGTGIGLGWLTNTNWNPQGIPVNGETATVSGKDTIEATGGTFEADLALTDTSKLIVTANSAANYLSVNGGQIVAAEAVSLGGKIATKDTLVVDVSGILTLDAQLVGVHKLIKKGAGKLILNADNSGFSGDIFVETGTLEASIASSLGKGDLSVANGAELIISNNNAFQPTSKLIVEDGAHLQLDANVTTSEFYLGSSIQPVGSYFAVTNPSLISGTGQIIVGRPSVFTFIGGANGNWDNPAHFIPALLPEAGETVNCEIEMETTSSVFAADIHLVSPGHIRLRGAHSATGTIIMEEGTYFNYNTGGTGMTLNAPIVVSGNIKLIMASANSAGSKMTLGGPISGNHTILAVNNGRGTVNNGTVVLTGGNSGFTGVWDITSPSTSYPDANYVTAIEGNAANAFGAGTIVVDLNNQVIFSHEKAAGDELKLQLSGNAKAVLNVVVQVKTLTINSIAFTQGTYSAITNPGYFEGPGSIIVNGTTSSPDINQSAPVRLQGTTLMLDGTTTAVSVYSIQGTPIRHVENMSQIELKDLKAGVYLIRYCVDGKKGNMKFINMK